MIEEVNFISHNRWQAKHYNPINWEWDDPNRFYVTYPIYFVGQ